jgi:hypothetical protein
LLAENFSDIVPTITIDAFELARTSTKIITLYQARDMKLRTVIDQNKREALIHHSDSLLSAGSCFAKNIGNKMSHLKWNIAVNPLGISYNPASLTRQRKRALTNDQIKTDELIKHQGLWHHFDFHGQFSGIEKEVAVSAINDRISETHHHLQHVNHVLLTLGTSWVFERAVNNEIVTNCHKLPAADFKRRMLTVREMIALFEPVLSHFKKKKVSVTLTVSPIRHISDGLIQNSKSKAALILLSHHLADQFDNVSYFPAYELLIDDLRDYRFYKDDLIHPSQKAIEYVWDTFKASCLSDSAIAVASDIEKVKQSLSHRPFHPASVEHQSFLKKCLDQILRFQSELAYTDWEEEIEWLGTQILID